MRFATAAAPEPAQLAGEADGFFLLLGFCLGAILKHTRLSGAHFRKSRPLAAFK